MQSHRTVVRKHCCVVTRNFTLCGFLLCFLVVRPVIFILFFTPVVLWHAALHHPKMLLLQKECITVCRWCASECCEAWNWFRNMWSGNWNATGNWTTHQWVRDQHPEKVDKNKTCNNCANFHTEDWCCQAISSGTRFCHKHFFATFLMTTWWIILLSKLTFMLFKMRKNLIWCNQVTCTHFWGWLSCLVTISYPLSETAGVLVLGVPIVHKATKCDHYFGILSNLHANDKAVPTDNKDKLNK